jgi:Zn2+/Cd2+-exporting ATPase
MQASLTMHTSAEFRVCGLHCHHEAEALRNEVGRLAGVARVDVDSVRGVMTVQTEGTAVTREAVVQAARRAGVQAAPRNETASAARGWVQAEGVAVALSGIALLAGIAIEGLPVDGLGAPVRIHDSAGADRVPAAALCAYLLSLAAALSQVAPRVWASARTGRFDMNLLVVLPATGAAVLGRWSEAAAVMAMFALARMLEGWSERKVRDSAGSLARVTPATAQVLHGNRLQEVPLEQVATGDVVTVCPGGLIPCDGEVLSGISAVREAGLTGEANPILKHPGDPVLGGSANGEGALEIRASHPGSDSRTARIAAALAAAQGPRPAVELWTERFASIYTPTVLALAVAIGCAGPVLTGGSWSEWLYRSMLVLLVSCPCALVISTPVTIAAAVASAAHCGVLLKGRGVLETVSRLRAVAFDKTGVITEGRPRLERMVTLNGYAQHELLSTLAAAEQFSEHVCGKAIFEFAATRAPHVRSAGHSRAIPGLGAEAEIGGEPVWVGGPRMVLEQGASSPGLAAQWAALGAGAQTVVACGSGGRVLGLVAMRDSVRLEAAQCVKALRKAGIGHTAMLTGDGSRPASAVADAAGMDEMQCGLLPEEKAQHVRALVERYGVVAMVGDGLNDALSLALAPVGIAFGAGAMDLAGGQANAVVLRDDLMLIPFLVRHGQRAMRLVKANIALVLGLKAAFLLLAVCGTATLWMAVIADTGATVLVTLNGLRMLRARCPSAAR